MSILKLIEVTEHTGTAIYFNIIGGQKDMQCSTGTIMAGTGRAYYYGEDGELSNAFVSADILAELVIVARSCC